MACLIGIYSLGSFPSCHGENHPNPMSDWEVDLDMLRCTMSCQGDETNPKFLHVFSGFLSQIPNFCNLPKSRRVGY